MVAEVAGLDVDVDVGGLAELVGELLEAVAAAGGQRDVVAALGELPREVGADPGGRAGDEDGRAVGRSGESHDEHPYPRGASGLTTAGASRSRSGIASRSPSTRCCAAGSSSWGSRPAEEIHETEPAEWALLERVHDGELLRRIRVGELSVREQRGLGLPWSPELVERGRRAVAGTRGGGPARARARGRDEPRRRHPPRRSRVRPRLLPLQRRRRARSRSCARRAACGTRSSSTATSTRATAPRTCSAPTPHAYTLSLHGARNYPFQRIPSDLDVDLPTGTGDADYLEALDHALDAGARPLGARDRVLPRRRRPVGGRPPRPPRPHQGRPARPRRARARPAARRRRGRLRRARRRLRRGRARHGRDQRRDRRGGRRPPDGGEGNRTPTSALQRPRAPVITTPPAGRQG